MIYVDSSALVKLVLAEPESPALDRHLAGADARVSCSFAYVELIRTARKRSPAAVERARGLLERIHLIAIDTPVLAAAADLEDDRLRSLDAVHVAAALSLEDDLAELITYDHRMAGAAERLGLAVIAPA